MEPTALVRAVAQLETSSGSKTVKGPGGEDSFNLFNIKGEGYSAKDNMLGTTSSYRVYKNRQESIDDFVSLVERKYPKAYVALQEGDVASFARELKAGGYAEDPDYVDKLIAVAMGKQTDYGNRPDGSKKGTGFLGELKLPSGDIATEYSVQSDAVKVKGKRVDFPTLVPTLTKEEVALMVNDIIPNDKEPPESIMQKAIKHANDRIKAGKSVFAAP